MTWGISIDSELFFNHHISKVCEKVKNQFSVLKRFKSLVTRNVMLPYIRLLYYHTFNIARLYDIFVALEIVIN